MTVTRGFEGGGELLPGDDVPKKVGPMVELGATGLRRTTGYVDEEFLPQLRGRKAVQIYREMSDNEPIIGALLFAVERLLREVDWRVEPATDDDEGHKAAEFVEECMRDMSQTWDDTITEILTMLPYGFSWHEIVYKKRVGPWETSPTKRSKYTDGKIGWRKLPIRAQETMLRWVFDDQGGIKAMVQMAPPYYKIVPIPIEKSLLFRPKFAKGNPEGRSMLRNAYRPWYIKKRLEEIALIGMERDLAGLPVAKVPRDYLAAAAGSDKAKMVDAFRKMVRSVRRDEQEGIILPQEYDPDTKQPLFEFELLTSGGTRQFDIIGYIQQLEQRMLMTVLADFILVGHEQTGSYSLHTDKSGLFRTAINSIAQSVADVFNMYAIPRLFAVNGWKLDQLPQLKPSDVDPPDLTQLGAFMGQMTSAGMTWFPDPELEKFIRQAARLPELTDEQEKIREAEGKQGDIMRLANQRLQMLQMEQTAQQGAMSTQQQAVQTEHAPAQAEAQTKQAQMALNQGDPKLQQAREDAVHGQKLKQSEDLHGQKLKMGEQKMKQSEAAHKLKLKSLGEKKQPPKGKK